MVNAQARIVIPLSHKQEDFGSVEARRVLGRWKQSLSRETCCRLEGSCLFITSFLCTTVYVCLLKVEYNCVRITFKP